MTGRSRARPRAGVAELIAAYGAGHSLEKVAAMVGSDRSTVRRRLIAAGLDTSRRGGPRAVPARFRVLDGPVVAAQYRAGMSVAAIARHHRTALRAVRRTLDAEGVTMRAPSVVRFHFDMDELTRRWLAGATSAQLAAEFGCSPATVLARLHAVGLRRGRWPGRERPVLDGAVLAARYAEGATLREVAAGVGASVHAVRAALVAAGVVIRPRFGRPPAPPPETIPPGE